MSLYRNSYKNAREVLPEALINRIKQYHTGLIWIPGKTRRLIKTKELHERNERIRELYEGGEKVSTIANTVYVSEERVRQIIRERKKNDGYNPI